MDALDLSASALDLSMKPSAHAYSPLIEERMRQIVLPWQRESAARKRVRFCKDENHAISPQLLKRNRKSEQIKDLKVSYCVQRRLKELMSTSGSGDRVEQLTLDQDPVRQDPELEQSCDSRHHSNEMTLYSADVPCDPRQWSRAHVQCWLKQMKFLHNVLDLDIARFPMNGKALCLMSADMFSFRVPSAGKLLYKDFRLRLFRAMSLGEPLSRG